MQLAVVGVQMRQQQQLEAAEHVVFGELQLLSDVGDLLVVDAVALFESFHVEVLVVSDRLHRLEEARLQDQVQVDDVLHPLKVGRGVLHHDQGALAIAQVVRINNLQQGAPDAKLLVGRQHEHLRDGDCGSRHFQVLLERRGEGD